MVNNRDMHVTVQDEAVIKVVPLCDADAAFGQLCEANPDLRVEQTSGGEIILMPPAGNESSYRNGEIISQLRDWARQDGRGKVFDSNTVFCLADGSKLGPDAAWIFSEKLRTFSATQRKRFLPVAPDFIIELRSESDRLSDLHLKMQRWIANGVQLAWLVDADQRRVWVYAPDGGVHEQVAKPAIQGQGPIAGFTLVTEEIYLGLDF